MRYIFNCSFDGEYVRNSDGRRGDLDEIPDTALLGMVQLQFVDPNDFHKHLPAPEPQPPTQADCIAIGKQHVQNAGYGADEKVICLNKLLKVKDEGTLASHPKLVTTYAWLETVQGMAVAGQTSFPPAPHTFEEVVSE